MKKPKKIKWVKPSLELLTHEHIWGKENNTVEETTKHGGTTTVEFATS